MTSTLKKSYTPSKVLDIKQQQGHKLLLIHWLNTPIQQATWQPEQKLYSSHPKIDHLIHEFIKAKSQDKGYNFLVKNAQKTQIGENPYYETTRHGHFLYGDKIQNVESIKVYQAALENQPTVIFEIRWKPRIEADEIDPSIKTVVILQNSFIGTATIAEYEPDFIAKFYQNKIRLNFTPQIQTDHS